MHKTIEQLQAELDREREYTTKLNRQIDRLRVQLRNTISLSEHEKLLSAVRRDYDVKLTEIKIHQQRQHNERGAGRNNALPKQFQMSLALQSAAPPLRRLSGASMTVGYSYLIY